MLVTLFLIALGPYPGLPEGYGLSAAHPFDRGLRSHPAVLLMEDFEEGALDDLAHRWESVSNRRGRVFSFVDETPVAGAGRRSLRLTATPGDDDGGHLYTRLPYGVDRLFLRFYVKFPDPPNYVHHFVTLGGYHPGTAWPQGGAGERPRGDDRVTVGIEPFGRSGEAPPPGDWNFYAYWHEMKPSADGRFWGNGLWPEQRQPVPADRWQCVEVMLQLNRPGDRDGRLALWLDGRLVADFHEGVRRGPWTGLGFVLDPSGDPFEGFDFRTTDRLKVNFVWMLHYVTVENQRRNRVSPERPTVVLFDQIVAATEYIGPICVGRP
ncbi:MAG: hypothetical protein KatS3mg108_2242 [Isosphaeraceae bacterium]|jgi:hypothetical protein|nr:MAG: hypothetical protein KatS3mg108_2242 [Isosphaeraceae bacterium]